MSSRVVVACVVAALLGCGSGGVGKQPSWRATKAPVEGARPRRTGAPIVLEPRAAGAVRYNARAVAEPHQTALSKAIIGAVADSAKAAGHTSPALDGRLFAVAEDLAPVAREDAPIPYPLVEFALRHHGIVEPTPHIILIWGPLDRHDVIAAQLRGRLPAVFESTEIKRVGVGAIERGDTGVILLVLQPSYIDTDPIPRRIAADDVAILRARVLAPYTDPKLFVTHEGGQVSQPRVVIGEGGRLTAEVSCRGHRGAQQIEITAVDSGGSAVLANFPVWCAVDPPKKVEVTPAAAGDEPVNDVGKAEALMISLVNNDRKDAGLPALDADARLAAVARAHSDEMRATGNVAHVSPKTGSAADRVRAANILTALVLENVARAYGVGEAQDGLMNSPGHRANILAREATHVGIGIALGETISGHRELFVTQVFTRVPPAIEPAAAVAQLVGRVERSSKLEHDADLTAIAGKFAVAIARGTSTEQAAKESSRQLDELSRRYRRVTTIINPVADLDAFPVDLVSREANMTDFGVGVAQGSHDVIGDGAIHVVILVGQRR